VSLPEVRVRDSARILLVDGAGRVLLFRFRGLDAALDDDDFWVTPGGGVDDGETPAQAAARELMEETGIAARAAELGHVVAMSRGTWCAADGEVVFRGTDHYFLLRTDGRRVDPTGLTELERDVIVGHDWWSADELRASDERIYPPGLGDLLDRLLAGDVPDPPVVLPWETERERVRGCLVGGAVGDALGGVIEFLPRREIVQRHGPAGLTTMVSNLITDDTQMTLFTAQGLVDASPGAEVRSVHQAYLDWLGTQTLPAPPAGAAGLVAEPWLYARRAPGNACLSGLQHTGNGPVNPQSKGCGTVMRSAPFGLAGLGPQRAFDLAADCARITHGHPAAAASAGAFAAIVDSLLSGADLQAAVGVAFDLLERVPSSGETVVALRAAVQLAEQGEPSADRVESLGKGWVAEEALAIAVYCALVAEHAWEGLLLAVNHSGDSDSTGSICGNLLGAERGPQEIPLAWRSQVEGLPTIMALADKLFDRRRRQRRQS
jgi:ADP-ribosylglycohydrolase